MKWSFQAFFLFLLVITSEISWARGRHRSNYSEITNFNQAKKYLFQHLDQFDNKTIYCSCTVEKKSVIINSCGYKVQSKKNSNRAFRVEWEHVVPAEAFGQSFSEWRSGSEACHKNGRAFKGRKCAETNPEFNRMESDLYNLYPEIGELNGLRSNYSMAELSESRKDFGGCHVKIFNRKFEPEDSAKGVVARTYLNFNNRYPGHGIVSNKNQKLFEAWDHLHPVTELECQRWKFFESKNKYPHLFADRCKTLKL